MDLVLLEKIKRLAIVSIVSDDYLLERLVLKGGNAIDLVYQLSGRASVDIDFSMQFEFEQEELDTISKKIEESLIENY